MFSTSYSHHLHRLVPFGSKTKTGHTGNRPKNTLDNLPDLIAVSLRACAFALGHVQERNRVRAAIYARVSTTDQKCEMQLAELREYLSRRALGTGRRIRGYRMERNESQQARI